MAFSMLQLYLLGALGPRLVATLGLSRTVLGLTTTTGFGLAALLSPVAGRLVDRAGPRRCLVALLALAAVALALIAAAPGTGVLLCAVALGGVPQALANPATNKVILAVVPAARRGAVTGFKQSGVQFGAFAAGLPLSLVAAEFGWRGAVWLAAGLAALTAAWAARSLPDDVRVTRGGQVAGRRGSAVGRLACFSLLLGCGIASVNTYVALFGTQRLGLGPTAAAALVAALGLAGIAGRVGWGRVAGRPGRAEGLPALLCALAVCASLLLVAAVAVPFAVWPGVVAVGTFAVSANAVSMVVVMQRAAPGRAGSDSALVSAGFFAGFAVGPPLFGTLVSVAGYAPGWSLVAAEFGAAAVVALPGFLRGPVGEA
ncbi:MFS transporter [Streptomyces sp. PTM05]|uniref:MFS transporter n=2 Tax=Streptantibioticus parmotrematis TaxID=2873249 RepID=A0ABS7QSG8_9ACTN|nr:MFS transporter [Streptantibioticus parmotrematis]